MHIRNLKVFCDVVARHSFSKAAEDNGITQSGASQAVQQLEDFLQVQLLDRSKRPFVLTSEGEVFYGGCCKLVRQFDNLTEEVRSLGQEISGRATVAAIYSVGLSYLPDLHKELKQRFPKTEIRFQFCHPDEVYRAVEQGSVDFGLVSYPQQSKGISATHWRDEPMVLVAPAGHHLCSRQRVTPEDLGLESLIAFAPNLRIRHEIDRYLRTIGITMPIAAEFDNVDSVKHALELNNAVAFLPRPAISEELNSGVLVALPCEWLTLQRPLGVIQRRDTSLGRTARALYELMFLDVAQLPKAAHDGAALSDMELLQAAGDRVHTPVVRESSDAAADLGQAPGPEVAANYLRTDGSVNSSVNSSVNNSVSNSVTNSGNSSVNETRISNGSRSAPGGAPGNGTSSVHSDSPQGSGSPPGSASQRGHRRAPSAARATRPARRQPKVSKKR